MKKLLMALCPLFAFAAASPAFAEINIVCNIGTFRISADNLYLENGQLAAKGYLYLTPRGEITRQIMMGKGNNSSSALEIIWNGGGNILATKFGNIILSPIKDTPRIDIQFPDLDFRDDGSSRKLLNPDGPLKQQGCIQQ